MLSPLIIAAPASGSGKTTLTLGLLAALKERGVPVAPFKVGPDYIDPGHHAAACGRVSRNLDGWMGGEQAVRQSFARGCAGAEVALVEGVMGLFDGAAGDSDAGSTAEIARWLNGRVLLVVDARSQARSIAALVKGFVDFDPRLHFAGVVCNRVGSGRHRQLLERALATTPGLPPLLGCLPRDSGVALPERHLGLVTAGDAGADYRALAELVETHLDIDALLAAVAGPAAVAPVAGRPAVAGKGRIRIAVARDAAFCFCYPENLELLEAAGADLVFFSPLADRLPEAIDGIYLPGGYPELHAGRLAANRALLSALKERITAGLPVYAECGGLLLLAAAVDGRSMAGVLPGKVRMQRRRQALGYRLVHFVADTPLGPAGTVARGHAFHYSALELAAPVKRAYRLSRPDGEPLADEGFRVHNLLASYVHLHFAGNPALAGNFVDFCARLKK